MTLRDAAARLDNLDSDIDEVLAAFDEVEQAIEDLADAYEQLAADPNDGTALNELQRVARTYHTGYGDETGVVSRLNGTIEELAGPADELRGVLEVDALRNDLITAFGSFEDVAGTFTYAKSSTVSTPVEESFLDELESRIEDAPDRLEKTRTHLQQSKQQLPDPAEMQQKLDEARRERELEEARRMREMMDDADED